MPVNSRRRRSTWVYPVTEFFAFVVTFAVVLLLGSCAGGSDVADPYAPLRDELAPFRVEMRSSTPAIRERYDGCDGSLRGVTHDTWSFTSRDGVMAVHVWQPPDDADPLSPGRGTVLLVHGYVASPCELTPVIRALLANGYGVVAPELPGHGLSDGPRGDIDSFGDYGQFLIDLDPVLFSFSQPYGVVAHSTGASAVLERLRSGDDPYERIVFLAPLIRPRGYGPSRLFRWCTKPFIRTIPARNTEEYGFERIPLHWFDALVEWNRDLEKTSAPISDRKIRIIQGQSDRVVAWRYNLRVLGSFFPSGEQIEIRDLPHVPSSRTEAGRRAIAEIVAYFTTPE